MREVTIPNDYNPFRLEVNGRIYSYKAGTTQSVPDEVAELIDMYNKSKPVPKENSIIDNSGLSFQKTDADKVLKVKEDGSDVEWSEGGGSGSDLPEYSASDAGSVLTVNASGNGLEWAESGSGGGNILIVRMTSVYDETSLTQTLSATWQEIYSAIENNSAILIYQKTGSLEDEDYFYNASSVVTISCYDGYYAVRCWDTDFITDTPNGYPTFSQEDG